MYAKVYHAKLFCYVSLKTSTLPKLCSLCQTIVGHKFSLKEPVNFEQLGCYHLHFLIKLRIVTLDKLFFFLECACAFKLKVHMTRSPDCFQDKTLFLRVKHLRLKFLPR